MTYKNILSGRFVERPNRFIAHIEIDGRVEVCHVKNTGRCRELLVPGARVWCQRAKDPKRKTRFDLIAVDTYIPVLTPAPQAPQNPQEPPGTCFPLFCIS